jgi:tetratricopeptide (TPR) repeat protein
LHELKKYHEEVSCYERAIALFPKNHQLWNAKGDALFCVEPPEYAVPCYENAIKLFDNPYSWKRKGDALHEVANSAHHYAKYLADYWGYLDELG